MKKFLCAVAALTMAGALGVRAEDAAKPEAPRGERMRPMMSLDKDGDGKITVAEFVAQSAEFSKMRFSRADADGDGKVTEAELEAARAKQAAHAERPGNEGRPRAEIPAFASLDTNKDGAITTDEFAAYSSVKAGEKAKELDKNGDGVLGKDELPLGGGPGGRPRGPQPEGSAGGPPPAPK